MHFYIVYFHGKRRSQRSKKTDRKKRKFPREKKLLRARFHEKPVRKIRLAREFTDEYQFQYGPDTEVSLQCIDLTISLAIITVVLMKMVVLLINIVAVVVMIVPGR